MIKRSSFKPAWWLPGRHLQTIVPNSLRPRPRVPLERQRVELPDGDFVDVDWTREDGGPIVIVLHGLEGSIESRYAAGIMQAFWRRGWRGALLHHRGCSGEPNRLPNGYHSGHTADFDFFLRELRKREPRTPIAALGYSLGGNVLLKWLGETGDDSLLDAAVAVSVPFRLEVCAAAVNRGLSRLYQAHLMRRMRQSALRKIELGILDFPPERLRRLRSFRDFDEALTGPLHGYGNADGYYAAASSRQFLKNIRTPTLIIQSRDDPFMTPEVLPAESELSPAIHFELSEGGGHVGFVGGKWPWKPRFWLEERIPSWLEDYLLAEHRHDVTLVLEWPAADRKVSG